MYLNISIYYVVKIPSVLKQLSKKINKYISHETCTKYRTINVATVFGELIQTGFDRIERSIHIVTVIMTYIVTVMIVLKK